ncbi:hypothetical protein J4481_00320, partial [Candidatus Pacearchaeota archaeon]|nr:hypothetical protein [Candidatus Pacearchaeota archaeon]
MKKLVVLFFIGIFFILPLVLAEEQVQNEAQVQTYSGFNRFVDNVKMVFSFGDNKVRLASEIREKEVYSAINNVKTGDEEGVEKNLEGAWKKLQTIQEKVSLDTADEVMESSKEIREDIVVEENLPKGFEVYVLEEEKTGLTAVLTEKTYEYCSELAKEDFALMLKDEECNPKTAPEPLKKDLEKLKDLQERMFVKLMLEIRSCIDDPGTCNCEN